MLWLKASVVIMSVLIVAGVGVIVVTLVNRMSAVPAGNASAVAPVLLDEPAGTRIAGTSMNADRLAIQLQGGGPDRVVVLDLRAGRVLGRVGLAR